MSLTRKTPMRRGTKPMKRGRVKPVNTKRRAKNFARAYGSKERVAFVKRMRCVVGRLYAHGRCSGPIDVAHTEGGGVGYKADASTTVPLCRYHHQNLHLWGRRSFELAYGVHLEAEAKAVESLFRQLHPEGA